MKCGVIIVAAGQGLRLGQALRPSSGQAVPKAFVLLNNQPLYQFSLQIFSSHPDIQERVLVVPKSEATRTASGFKVVSGGETRQKSVACGLEALSKNCEGVLVHDAARPFVTTALVDRLLAKLKRGQNAIPVIPIPDTVKQVEAEKIVRTVDRRQLMLAQTPQACLVSDLKKAFKEALTQGWQETDEASLLEKIGISVFTVAGDPNNMKMTTPEDFKKAERFLKESSCG